MDFEKEIEKLAQQYLREGFTVLLHPREDQLPDFARDFGVDILATRGEEHVLVQVKEDRLALESDPDVPVRAGITKAHPGWQYDLVVLSEGDPFRRLTREAREPSREEIDDLIGSAESFVAVGDLRAACVFAWAAFEAAMRQVASDAELYTPMSKPGELLATLYGNGFLSREDFDLLKKSFRVRTEIVHGLVPPAIEPGLVHGILAAARHLLTGNPDRQGVAS